MKKIIFTGDNLTDKERKEFLNQGFQIDAYDTNLSNAEIVDIVNRNQYDGYILGGDENLDSKTIAKFLVGGDKKEIPEAAKPYLLKRAHYIDHLYHIQILR